MLAEVGLIGSMTRWSTFSLLGSFLALLISLTKKDYKTKVLFF